MDMKPDKLYAIVTKGDRIPWDGTVIDGFALVDESAVAGVSKPQMIEAVEGRNNVLAGSLILEGCLTIESPMEAHQRVYKMTETDKELKARMNGDSELFGDKPIYVGPHSNRSTSPLLIVLGIALFVAIFVIASLAR